VNASLLDTLNNVAWQWSAVNTSRDEVGMEDHDGAVAVANVEETEVGLIQARSVAPMGLLLHVMPVWIVASTTPRSQNDAGVQGLHCGVGKEFFFVWHFTMGMRLDRNYASG
jgi:hypothetical protein